MNYELYIFWLKGNNYHVHADIQHVSGTSLGVIYDLWSPFFTCSQLVITMLSYLCENKMN